MEPRSCCAPSRGTDAADLAVSAPAGRASKGPAVENPDGLLTLPGAEFAMGCADSPYPADGEGPVRQRTVPEFRIAATTVTNERFADFIEATGYRTDAERFGWSFVFAGLLPESTPPTRGVADAPWWRQVFGATWRRPEGADSSVDDRLDHPVVHVSQRDALAYCAWTGTRLPTEPEWEYAARGGLEGQRFPWGDELTPGGVHRMNVWQGDFPRHDTATDGFAGTAPADAFAPNGFGLYNTTGNVWEWTADGFDTGPGDAGTGTAGMGDAGGGTVALRGGSYLCHHSYCLRYRTSARMGNTPDSSTGNIGFRVAD